MLAKLRAASNKKTQNIFELEIDKILNKEPPAAPGIFSFSELGKEGFTDFSLISLGSPGNIPIRPLGS